ncbi:MAG: dockerin type I domain-containing protein [Planctomycetota bacterium]
MSVGVTAAVIATACGVGAAEPGVIHPSTGGLGTSNWADVDELSVSFGIGDGGETGIDEIAFVSLAALDGDFNGDGAVTDADYTLFQVAYGQQVEPGTVADGNADGVIDAADYTVWRDARALAPAASAPEPAAALLAVVLCLMLPPRRFA